MLKKAMDTMTGSKNTKKKKGMASSSGMSGGDGSGVEGSGAGDASSGMEEAVEE